MIDDFASVPSFLSTPVDELSPIQLQTLELAAEGSPVIESHFRWKKLLRVRRTLHESAAADDPACSLK